MSRIEIAFRVTVLALLAVIVWQANAILSESEDASSYARDAVDMASTAAKLAANCPGN